jgi:hypothetical protein
MDREAGTVEEIALVDHREIHAQPEGGAMKPNDQVAGGIEQQADGAGHLGGLTQPARQGGLEIVEQG